MSLVPEQRHSGKSSFSYVPFLRCRLADGRKHIVYR